MGARVRWGLALALVASAALVQATPPTDAKADAGAATDAGATDTAGGDAGPVVALVVREPTCGQTERPFLCSGVLLGSQVVATAAHCLRRQAPSSLLVVYGDVAGGTAVPVESGTVHPGYDGAGHDSDLALLWLEQPGPRGFRPATLRGTPLDAPSVTEVRWAGYGAAHAAGSAVGGRRAARAPVLALGEHEIRYGAGGGGTMSCRGDSGGPVLAAGAAGEELVGITTWGDPACKRFGVALRLDRHLDFVRAFLRRAVHPRARPPLDVRRGLPSTPCRRDEDCPQGTACFGWPGQPRWCTYRGLPPGRFTRRCTTSAECGGDHLCVDLPPEKACRCFVPDPPALR